MFTKDIYRSIIMIMITELEDLLENYDEKKVQSMIGKLRKIMEDDVTTEMPRPKIDMNSNDENRLYPRRRRYNY